MPLRRRSSRLALPLAALALCLALSPHAGPVLTASDPVGQSTDTSPRISASTPGPGLAAEASLAPPKILDLSAPDVGLSRVVEDYRGDGQREDAHEPDGDGGQAPAPAPGNTTTPSLQSPPASQPADPPGQDQSSAPMASPEPTSSAVPPTVTPSATAEPSSSAGSPGATQPPAAAPSSSTLPLRLVLGAGALLAAALTGALALRAALRRRRRTPGEETTAASPASAATTPSAATGRLDAARLDVALRTLLHHAAGQEDDGPGLPALQAARITAQSVEVLPEDTHQQPVAPFTAGQHGWWTLPPKASVLDEDKAEQVPAPYPGLVTIGSTQDGDLLLLNLPQLPALLLEGYEDHIRQVCTSLALELAMSPWAADTHIVTVGFGEELPQLLPAARITRVRQPEQALRDVSEWLLEAHQMLTPARQPHLVLCACALDADTAWQFADVLDRARSVPVALIAPASGAAAYFPQAPILDASASQPQPLPHVSTDVTVQRLTDADYRRITAALRETGHLSDVAGPEAHSTTDSQGASTPQHRPTAPHEPSTPAALPSPPAAEASGEPFPALLSATTGPSALRPTPAATSSARSAEPARPDTATAPPRPAAPAATSTSATSIASADAAPRTAGERPTPKADQQHSGDAHAPEIRVLGPVEVTGVDHTGHGPRIAQLAALLYFRPGRSPDLLCADMDPDSPWSTSTLNARMQGLRSALGRDPSGKLYVPRRKAGEDPYRLSPGIRCDWTHFLNLVEGALPMGPSGVTHLEQALTLVRGVPFGGRPLPWAEPHQQEMITRIIDVAHTVATYRIADGPHHNLHAARRAVATGLDVDDTAEVLYRDWMRLEAARGNRSGLHTAIARVQQVLRALDCPPEPATEQLIHDLLAPSPAKGHTR
ncbi:bacterial transcriptional activator domain-containing protein [Streptomyces broussonetiae]|uniref:Bacterial transcriptional activator domain-containing protein n=1 Tax=Streptomyces broussonetiae TaxID=2686304 RepID=A0ABV5EHN6_9ACTN